jgi:hypothetical protein
MPKFWKTFFALKNFAVGESLLTLVAEHGSEKPWIRLVTINDTKVLPDNRNKWPRTS